MARTKTKTKAKSGVSPAGKKKSAVAKVPARKVAAVSVKKKVAKTAAKAKTAARAKTPAKKTAAARGAKLKSAARAAVKGLAKVAPVVAGAASLATVAATLATATSSKAKSATKTDFSHLLSPLEDRLLVLIDGVSDWTAGGLFIPGTVDERPNRGRVVAVGRGVRNKKGQLRPLEVRVGETVLFAESAGSKLTLAGAELLMIRESELLGVVG